MALSFFPEHRPHSYTLFPENVSYAYNQDECISLALLIKMFSSSLHNMLPFEHQHVAI